METITSILVSITTLITAICSLIIAGKKLKKEFEETIPKKIKRQCDIDLEIVKRMEQIKEILNADRVQIYDFHNGGHYANGRSALKTSCTYEVVRTGVKACQMYLQAIPLNCIPHFIQTLLNTGKLKINDLEEIKNNMPATYTLKKSQNIGSFFDIILNNRYGEPIGFLAFQYSKTNKVNFTENEKNEILRLKFFIEENLEKMISRKEVR